MTTLATKPQARTERGLALVALAFVALTLVGAAVDRRGAALGPAGAASQTPLSTEELVIEMLTHD